MEEKLINVIREHPIIFDKRRADFRDVLKKKNAWTEVARKMHLPVSETQRRWRTIRDRYVRTKRSDGSISSSSAGGIPSMKWELMPLLSFLDDFVTHRPSTSSLESGNAASSLDNNSEMLLGEAETSNESCPVMEQSAISKPWSPALHCQIVETNLSYITPSTSSTSPNSDSETPALDRPSIASPDHLTNTPSVTGSHRAQSIAASRGRKRRRLHDTEDSISESIITLVANACQGKRDELDCFGNFVSSKLRRLPPIPQQDMMQEINNMLSEAVKRYSLQRSHNIDHDYRSYS